jgi:hypothetical protein
MPRLKPMLVLLLLPFALLLSSCGKMPAVSVPDSLTNCRDEPRLVGQINDPLLAEFIVDLVEWGRECQTKLRAVKGLVQP